MTLSCITMLRQFLRKKILYSCTLTKFEFANQEIEVAMECEEGEVQQTQPQQGEEEITFMVQVQRDDEEQHEQDPQQHG